MSIDTSNTRRFALIGGPMDGKDWMVTMTKFFWPDSITINVPIQPSVTTSVPHKDGEPVVRPEDFELDFTTHAYDLAELRADVPNCLHLRTLVYVHSEHEMCQSDVDDQLERWGLL